MMKTQFMSFWDGLVTDSSCQIMIVGATNRPQDVDVAILRRMPSMFCIGLPVSNIIYLEIGNFAHDIHSCVVSYLAVTDVGIL